MRKAFVVMAAAMLLFAAQTAMAQQIKIGVVNFSEVGMTSEAFKKANSEIKAKLSPIESELQKAQDELKKLDEEYKTKSVALTQQAKADKENELRGKFQKLTEIQQRGQQIAQTEQKRLGEPLVRLAQEIIAEYGAKNGFTVILDSQALLYGTESVNITKDVIRELDAAAKAGRMPTMPAAPGAEPAAPSKSKKK